MSNETCAKQRKANIPMQEDTDSEIFYQKYILSEEIATKLKSIRKSMKENIAQANPTWNMITGESEGKICSDEDSSTDNDDEESDMDTKSQMACNQSILQLSTQFYFSQVERTRVDTVEKTVTALPQMCDILESSCENLERNNGKLDFTQFENLSNDDLISLASELAGKLSSKGIYNLCQSMNDMTIEQGMKYLNVLCMHLLLPKIIELEEPSRLLSSAIGECVKKFPNEIQRFIFVPILNAELKDTTLIVTIVNTCDPQKRTILLEEFLANTEELKSWHISLLQNFLSVRFDHKMIDKITKLFSGKALCYSKDKNFGKLVLSFLKINTMLSEEQKSLMSEIIAVNETLFKRPMENILKNM